MPRNSWTSLLGDDSPEADATDPLREDAAGADALSLPSELVALQQERAALEARMAALTGRSGESSGETRRFPVTPLGERRRADEAWARQRDLGASYPSGSAWRQDMQPGRSGAARNSDQPDEREPMPALRTGQRLIRGLALRDRLQGPRLTGRATESDAEPGREAVSTVEHLRDGLDQGPSLPDRWQTTSDALATRVERFYNERRDRLLAVATGGSGDLDARAEQAREKALEARRLERQRQQADDERVTRARQRSRDLPGDSP